NICHASATFKKRRLALGCLHADGTTTFQLERTVRRKPVRACVGAGNRGDAISLRSGPATTIGGNPGVLHRNDARHAGSVATHHGEESGGSPGAALSDRERFVGS